MLRRLLGIALCLSLPLAHAANNRATDAAFAALLSMPGAEPETGSWNFPELQEFSPDDEKSLIAYLARQQKAGGDFNAYRHHGTLLHHAIRAGKPATALWLLQHGADPRLKAEGSDALDLSVRYKLPQVRKALLEKYGMAPPKSQPVAAAQATQAVNTPLPVHPPQRVQDAVSKNARSPAALEKALASLSEGLLAEYYGVALAAMSKAGNVPADSWRILWRHLGKPAFGQYEWGLAATIPYEQWPALVAAGYRNDSAERALGCMVAESTAADLKIKWQALEKTFPDFRQVVARMVLHSYRIPTVGGYCNSSQEKELKAKLEWLRANDIKTPVPGILESELEVLSPATKLAMQPYIAKPVVKPRFVSVKPQCKFTLDDAWLKRFASAEAPLDGISLVEIPGDTQCAVLDSWTPRSEYPSGLTDNFTGPTWESIPSCADVPEHQVVWRSTKDGIVTLEHEIDVSSFNFPAPVRDNASGQLYYLDNGARAGKCSGSDALPFVYEWQRKDGQWRLAANNSSEMREALFAQCSAPRAENCKGIKWPSDGDPYFYMLYSDFLKKFASERRGEYLAAVMSMDKEKLQKLEAGPLPAYWVTEAITAVGKSDLPLAEKRKRTARLFRDHELLARAMEEQNGHAMMESLVAWLPAEDWGPIFGVLRKYPYRYYAEGVRDEARNQDKKRLACDLDNMLGLLCGETLGQ